MQRQDPSGDAYRLLAVLSLLAPEGISRALLKEPDVVAALDIDAARLDSALVALAGASLITQGQPAQTIIRHADPVVVTVHRLTGKVVRHHAAQSDTNQLTDVITQAAAMLTAMAEQLGQNQVVHRRHDLNELVAHIYTLRTHTEQPTHELTWLANWAGRRLKALGDVTRSTAIHERNLADRERLLGIDHPDTLLSRNNLAESYRAAGRHEDADRLDGRRDR